MQSIILLEEIVTSQLAGCAVGKCKMVPTCAEEGVPCVLDDSDIDRVLESDWLTDGLPETRRRQATNCNDNGLVPGIDY